MLAIQSFLNPFDVPDKGKLYCISSGATVPTAVEKDMMAAESIGKQAKERFIKERLHTKEWFFDPVKKLKLKTFQSGAKKVKSQDSRKQNYHIQTARQRGHTTFSQVSNTWSGLY